MPEYSPRSEERLKTCHHKLQEVFNEVIQVLDVTVLEGHRPIARQLELYQQGKSKVKQGKHNTLPSLAVDVAPYPIDWTDSKRFFFLAGVVMGIAHKHGVTVRWGGDWSMDNDFTDQTFNDYPHFELILEV